MKGRRADVDTAKGLGMLLVIIGHCQPPESLQTAIYGLHMPLFFFISGLMWRGQVRLAHSARSLWIPFVLASLVSWILWMVKQRVHASGDVPWWGPLMTTIWGGDLNGWLVHNTPLWFLPAMLSLLTALWILGHVFAPRTALIGLAALGLIVLALPSNWMHGRWPMSLGQGLLGGVFFAIGWLAAQHWPPRGAPMGGLAVAASVALALFNGRVDLFSMQFQQPLIYLAAGATGAWGVLALCSAVPLQLTTLQILGRHSLLILAAHLPVLWMLRAAIRVAHLSEAWWLLTLFCVLLMFLLSLWRDRAPPPA